MQFTGVNYFAIVVAALAAFGLGWAWYHVLSKQWLAAIGKTPEQLNRSMQGPRRYMPFVVIFVSLLVMGWMLAGIMVHIPPVSVRSGLISGFFLWFGFVLTTMATNHAFQALPSKLTMIDGGYWLTVLLLQGAVIGAFG